MKKILKIVGCSVAGLILLLLLLPMCFSGKIKDVAIEQANKMLDAEVYMGDFSLNFFKNFPHATVVVDDFGIAGKGEFSGDTLLDVKELNVAVNLMSLFSGNYEVNSVRLINASANAKVLESGKANWDVFVSSDTAVSEEPADTASSAFALALQSVVVEKLNVKFVDMQSKMYASVSDLDLKLSGEFSQGAVDLGSLAKLDVFKLNAGRVVYADKPSDMAAGLKNINIDLSCSVADAITKLKTSLGVEALTFVMDKVPYLSKSKLSAVIDLNADLAKSRFELSDNSISLNEIKLGFDGFVEMPDTSVIDMDLKLNAPDIDFKQILSLIPAVYAKDFEKIKTSGKVSLSAVAKGRMQGDTLPMFDVNLNIADAMFKYPDLPSEINGINVNLSAKNPGGVADLTEVDVPVLNFVMAGNPFEAKMILKTPVSDPEFDFGAKGTIDFGKLTQVIPLDSMQMNGVFNANLGAKGKLSYVEKEQYEKFFVDGNLSLSNLSLVMSSLPYDVNVSNANLDFSTTCVDLSDLKVRLGKNDINAKGKLTNFLPYVLRGDTIKGKLSVNSAYFNLNDFMTADTSVSETEIVVAEDTSAMSVIEIPGNVDFDLNVLFSELIYDNIKLEDAVGVVVVKDKVVDIKELSTKTFGGKMLMSGYYDTKNVAEPKVDFNFGMSKMSISKVFTDIEMLKSFVPALADAGGDFSMNLSFATRLLSDMTPDLKTVFGNGSFSTDEVVLNNVEILDKLSKALKKDELKDPKLNDLGVVFSLSEGRLTTEPFSAKVGSSVMTLSGSSGLDQTLDYVTKIDFPKENSKIPVSFDVLIKGTFSDPKFSVSAKSMVSEIKNEVKEKVDEVKSAINEKAVAAAKKTREKMIADAEKKAEEIRKNSNENAEKLVADAKAEADKLVAGAKNKLDKAAKKKIGDKLISEAEKNAEKIRQNGEERAQKHIDDQTALGDKLVKEAEKK